MNEVRKTLGIGMLGVAFLIGFTVGVKYWFSTWDPEILQWTMVGLFWTVLTLIFVGLPLAYYFGREQATGFLAGADAVFDGIVGKGLDNWEKKSKASAQVPSTPLLPDGGDPYRRPVVLPRSEEETGFSPPNGGTRSRL